MRTASGSVGLRMTAHNFRHSYALRLEAAGVRVADIPAFMGDEVETVQATYLNHPGEDDRARALAAM
jgi:integrase